MTHPTAGSKTPSFTLPDQDGTPRTLASFATEKIVLFFYPKDDTPGCTLEGQEFSAYQRRLKECNAMAVGISGGSSASKRKFCEKRKISVPLLADEEFAVAKQFGIFGEKQFMGKKYMGIFRTTFILDIKRGVIERVFAEVSPEGHAQQVLEHLKNPVIEEPVLAPAARKPLMGAKKSPVAKGSSPKSGSSAKTSSASQRAASAGRGRSAPKSAVKSARKGGKVVTRVTTKSKRSAAPAKKQPRTATRRRSTAATTRR